MEEIIQIRQIIIEESFFKSPDFYDNFQQVAKNIKGFCFFFPSTFISII